MYLAVDIGGTKTLVALFSRRGRVLSRYKFKTAWKKEKFIEDLSESLRQFDKYDIRSVTVAVPGVVQKNYTICFGNRNWGCFSLVDNLKKLFNCPIYFENDANLASIYESSGLSGKTIFLTFSTGIGGGIAENGKLLGCSSGFEPGHWVFNYNGKESEWEDLAAASALEKAFHVDMATELRGKAIMQEIARRMALGIERIIKEYQPDNIIIGGPISKIFRLFAKYLPKNNLVKYRRSKRPLESVIYGCYLFCKNQE